MTLLQRAGPLLQSPQWVEPAALGLAAALLLLGAARWRARRRGRRLLGPRAPRPGAAAAAADLLPWLALAAVAAALAGPRLGFRTERVRAAGADVVVVLDVSRSMTAGDVPPSRLHRARRVAAGLLRTLTPGDRVALAAFAGHGVLLTPLTSDRGALLEMLPFVDEALVPSGGSHRGDGLAAALAAWSAEPGERPRVALLLSDGEDPLRRPVGASAAEAARSGVRVVAVAFGSEAGARIPDGDAWLRDRYGREVVTRRELEPLARLAEMTDGAVFAADRWGEVDPAVLRAAVRRDVAPLPGEAVERRVAAVHTVPFAALAFGLLALEALGVRDGWRSGPGSGRPGRGRLRSPHAARAALLAGALLGVGLGAGPGSPEERAAEAWLRRGAADPRALVHLGIARAERGRHAEARRAFAGAALLARDPGLAAVAYFDLGVAALSAGDLPAARDAFFDAVALDPGHRRAVFNLEWTLAALEAHTPPPPPPSAQPDQADREPPPRGEETPQPAAASPEPLTPEEMRRWLEAVQDDPRRGLRAGALAAPAEGEPRRGEPAW